MGIFVDFSKGFDTIDHQVLIKNLRKYVPKRNNICWFQSYLKVKNNLFLMISTTQSIF